MNTKLTVVPAEDGQIRQVVRPDLSPDGYGTSSVVPPFEYSFSKKFEREVLAQGLQLAEECVRGDQTVIYRTGGAVSCPDVTAALALDKCLARYPEAAEVGEDGTISCGSSSEGAVFRGPIIAETVGEGSILEWDVSVRTLRLGPYRFTEVNTGKTEDRELYYPQLQWVKGRPTIVGGGFYSFGDE